MSIRRKPPGPSTLDTGIERDIDSYIKKSPLTSQFRIENPNLHAVEDNELLETPVITARGDLCPKTSATASTLIKPAPFTRRNLKHIIGHGHSITSSMSTLSLLSLNSDRHDTPYWKYHVLKFGKDLYLTTNPDLKHIYCRNGPGVYVEVVPTSTDDGFSLLFRHTHGIESPPYMIILKFGPNITVDTIGEVISLPHKSHEGIPSVDYTFTFEGTVYKIGSVSRTRVSKRNMWSGKNGDEQLKYIDKRNIYFRRLVVGGLGEEQQRKEKEDLFNPAARNSVLGLFRPNEVKLKKKLIRTAKGFLDERHTDTHRHSAGSEEDLTVGTDVDKFFQDMGDGFFTGSKPADDSPDDNKLGWITIYESLQSAEQNAQFFNLVLGISLAIGFDQAQVYDKHMIGR
jgi:hypothetical protein